LEAALSNAALDTSSSSGAFRSSSPTTTSIATGKPPRSSESQLGHHSYPSKYWNSKRVTSSASTSSPVSLARSE
jgi:hypothetical protein